MKYVDYPMPNDNLIKILSEEYGKQKKGVCVLSNLEQKASLNEIFFKIEKSEKYLDRFKKMGGTEIVKAKNANATHLKLITAMGITNENAEVSAELGNSKTCFYNYLKCEMEILKALLFLIFLDNLNYNKKELICIANERIDIISNYAL